MTKAGGHLREASDKCSRKNFLILVLLFGCIVVGTTLWPFGAEHINFIRKKEDIDLQKSIESGDFSVSSRKQDPIIDSNTESKNENGENEERFGSAHSTATTNLVTHSAIWRHLQESITDSGRNNNDTQDTELVIEEKLFHSPSLFAMNYEDMLLNLKLYIYPLSDDAKYDFRSPTREIHENARDIRGTDKLFFQTLSASRFVTDDPEEAQLFLIPISITALWNDYPGDSKRIANFMKGYVQQIRDRYPYWDRTLGADHVFLSCHQFRSDSSRNVLELKKNAIQIACSPLDANGAQDFFPHKDITLPLFEGEEDEISSCTKSKDDHNNRKHTLYYGGPVTENGILASVYESWKTASGFFLDSAITGQPSHLNMFSASKFCLSVGAIDRTSVVDSLRCGCVPVVFSTSNFYDLPFQDIIDWHKFSIILDSKDMGKLKKFLTAIPKTQLKSLQHFASKAGEHMRWYPLTNPYNSFHMVMYELWTRSHTIRYTRRNLNN